MTPDKLAKSGTEHGHQTALFAYVAVAYLHGFEVADEWCKTGKLPKYDTSPEGLPRDMQDDEIESFGRVVTWSKAVPALEWFHAIHNQGHGDKVRGANAKAEGVRKGVADTFLPWPVAGWHGLYIEMKKPTERPKTDKGKGGVSDEQAQFGEYAKSVGYGFMVCYGWEHAVCTLRSYIEWEG
jgi:hypothetical protein